MKSSENGIDRQDKTSFPNPKRTVNSSQSAEKKFVLLYKKNLSLAFPTVRIDSTALKTKWHDVNKHFVRENLLPSVRSKAMHIHTRQSLMREREKRKTYRTKQASKWSFLSNTFLLNKKNSENSFVHHPSVNDADRDSQDVIRGNHSFSFFSSQ